MLDANDFSSFIACSLAPKIALLIQKYTLNRKIHTTCYEHSREHFQPKFREGGGKNIQPESTETDNIDNILIKEKLIYFCLS